MKRHWVIRMLAGISGELSGRGEFTGGGEGQRTTNRSVRGSGDTEGRGRLSSEFPAAIRLRHGTIKVELSGGGWAGTPVNIVVQ
jgi:hypothetical protein